MKHFDPQPARRSPVRRGLAIGTICLAAALSLVPLRLVAKEPVPPADTDRPSAVPEVAPDPAAAAAAAADSPEGPAPDEETLLALQDISYLKSPEAALAAAADGIVRTVSAEEGQHVKAGEVLVQLDPTRAAAELELARGDLELKTLELRRRQHLLREKAIHESEIAGVEIEIRRAQNVLAIKEHELAQTRVVAPFDGVAIKVDARPGVFLSRGSPAVTVIQADVLWAEVAVPPAGLPILKKGTRAEVWPIGVLPPLERIYPGRVTSISPVMRAGSQTAAVRVRIDRAPAELRPGSGVKVRFLKDKQTGDAVSR